MVTKTARVTEAIVRKIESGALREGDRLPSEEELAASHGVSVGTIQKALAKAGCNPGPADGEFGKNTDAAVRRYQKAHGLAVDGVVGPATAGRLGVSFKPPA